MAKTEKEKRLRVAGTTSGSDVLDVVALVLGKRYDQISLRLSDQDGCVHCSRDILIDDKTADKLAVFLRKAAVAARKRRRDWEHEMRRDTSKALWPFRL